MWTRDDQGSICGCEIRDLQDEEEEAAEDDFRFQSLEDSLNGGFYRINRLRLLENWKLVELH